MILARAYVGGIKDMKILIGGQQQPRPENLRAALQDFWEFPSIEINELRPLMVMG